jgi:hypothetical protein
MDATPLSKAAEAEPKPLQHASTFDQLYAGQFVSGKGGRGGAGGVDKHQNIMVTAVPEDHKMAPLSNADKMKNAIRGLFRGRAH